MTYKKNKKKSVQNTTESLCIYRTLCMDEDTRNPNEMVELWNAFRNGDKRAFNRLVTCFYQILYNYGTKLTQNHSLVEDCIQDLFLSIWRRREFLGDTNHVKFYLLKSLRRRIYLELKEKHKWLPTDDKPLDTSEFVGEFSIESKIIAKEMEEHQQRKLQHILSRLSKRQKEVIYLKFYQEMNYEEISNIMSISYQSVRNLIHITIRDLQSAWFTKSN